MNARISSLLVAAADVALMVCGKLPEKESPINSISYLLISSSPIFVLFGLISIWLADYLGEFVGPTFRGGYVDSPTPAGAFIGFGFLFLFIPLAAFGYKLLFQT